MQTVLHMLCPFNVKLSSGSRSLLGTKKPDGSGGLPRGLLAFFPDFGWTGSGATPARLGVSKRTTSFAISRICYLLTQLCLQRGKPCDVINLGLAKGAGQSSLQIAINYHSSQRIRGARLQLLGCRCLQMPRSALWGQLRSWGPVSLVPNVPCPRCPLSRCL